MKDKRFFLLLLCVVLASQILFGGVVALSDSDYQVRSLTDFEVNFPQGTSLRFQMSNNASQYVALSPVVGDLNGTDASLWVAVAYGGKFEWTSTTNTTLLLNCSVDNVKINGQLRTTGQNTTITEGINNIVEWSYTLSPIMPISLVMGLAGVAMFFGGAFYGVHEGKKQEWKHAISGLIIALIGFALIVGWFYT